MNDMNEEQFEDIYDYFPEAETDSLDNAFEESMVIKPMKIYASFAYYIFQRI